MRDKIVILLILISTFAFGREKKDVEIGVIFTEKLFLADDPNYYQKEFVDLLKSKYNVTFSENNQIEVGTEEEMKLAYEQLLQNPDVDVILNMGIIASYYAIKNDTGYSKPVLAPFILTDEDREGGSGIENLNYIYSDKIGLGAAGDLDEVKEVHNMKKIGYVHSKETRVFAPKLLEEYIKGLGSGGVEVVEVAIDDTDIQTKLEGVDLIYLGTIMNKDEEIKKEILQYANDNKIITFTFLLSQNLKEDILLAYDASEEYRRRIRRSALNLENYLEGQKLSETPVNIGKVSGQLIINSGLARKNSFWLPQEITQNAKVVDFTKETFELLTYEQAVELTLENNINKRVQELTLEKTEEEYKSAKSVRRPNLNAYGTYNMLDDASANRSPTTAKNEVKAGISLKQVIFNEDANAGVEIYEGLYTKGEYDLRSQELDTVYETSVAYLNILQAEAFKNIYVNGYDLVKEYLNLAKTRRDVGISDSSDVYRFESELAKTQSDLVNASTLVENTKMNLNRILNVNINNKYKYEDLASNDNILMGKDEKATESLSNPWEFELIKAFVVQEGMALSPDIKATEELLKVKEREVKNKKRSMYSPEVAFLADYSLDLLDPWGVGDNYAGGKVEAEDEWRIGLSVTLPLYEGGDLRYERNQKEKELEIVMLQLESQKAAYEQQTLNLLNELAAKYSDVLNRKKAAEAARKNLDLVTDNYASGTTSIIALLDARTNAIAAEEQEVSSKYDFLKKKFEVERQIGIYYNELSEEEINGLFERYQVFKEGRE